MTVELSTAAPQLERRRPVRMQLVTEAHAGAAEPGCPEWCTADHGQDRSTRVAHTSAAICVPAGRNGSPEASRQARQWIRVLLAEEYDGGEPTVHLINDGRWELTVEEASDLIHSLQLKVAQADGYVLRH